MHTGIQASRGNHMGIAYSIAGAAEAAAVEKASVIRAIQDGRLRARRIDGQPVLLRADIIEWLESHPDYLSGALIGRTPESMSLL